MVTAVFRIATLALMLVLVASCSKEKEDPFQAVEDLIELYSMGDSMKIFELFKIPMTARTEEGKVNSVLDLYRDSKSEVQKDIQEFAAKKYQLLQLDTSSFGLDDYRRRVGSRFISAYFKLDTSFYLMRFKYDHDSLGRIDIRTISIRNLWKYCEFEQLATMALKVEEFLWSPATDKTFGRGVLRIKNGSSDRVKYIKLRLTLIEDITYKEFFNKTLELNTDIAPGDLIDIEVKELYMYPAGIRIQDRFWTWHAQFLHVIPITTRANGSCAELKRARAMDLSD